MRIEFTERGFPCVKHEVYPPGADKDDRVIQASSAIGDYEDSFDKPGSSFLWVSNTHHLNREEVAELITHMQRWLDTGYLETP